MARRGKVSVVENETETETKKKYREFLVWYDAALAEVMILPAKKLNFVHKEKSRVCLQTCCVIGCIPCCLYSTFCRLALCPCTCGGSLGGTTWTAGPDECMINCCKEIDKTKDYAVVPGLGWVAHLDMKYDRDRESKMIVEKVNHVLIEFKKRFFAEDITIYEKYKMVDWMQIQLCSLGYKTSSSVNNRHNDVLSPLNVCDVINTINTIIGSNTAIVSIASV